jgi:hypothetical protein
MYGRTALLLRARVEGGKGSALQSVTERCVATHGQCGSGARRVQMRRHSAGKNKAKENTRPLAVLQNVPDVYNVTAESANRRSR